jgi:hypothetical protein
VPESDFGADLYGVTDLTPTLDEVSGGLCVAQRIARSWLTPNGGLWYDPGLGEALQQQVNAVVYPARLAPRLRAQALRDECVEDALVEINFTSATKTLEVLATITLTDGSDLQFSLRSDGVTAELLLGS